MNLRKYAPLAGAVVSVLVILLGLIVFISACALPDSLSVSNTYVSSYSFGADFYTEMYNVTYKAVDQLKYIADGLETGFSRVLTCLSAVAKGIGVLVISIGLISLGRSIPAVLDLIPAKAPKASEPAVQPVAEVEAVQEAEVEAPVEEVAFEEIEAAEAAEDNTEAC